jgi:hypothetical protein
MPSCTAPTGDRPARNRRICSRHRRTGYLMWNALQTAGVHRWHRSVRSIISNPIQHGSSGNNGMWGYSSLTGWPSFPITPASHDGRQRDVLIMLGAGCDVIRRKACKIKRTGGAASRLASLRLVYPPMEDLPASGEPGLS